jgi:hypothetical protein
VQKWEPDRCKKIKWEFIANTIDLFTGFCGWIWWITNPFPQLKITRKIGSPKSSP